MFRIILLCLLSLTAQADIAGCKVFPDNNHWNTRVDKLPVHKDSVQWVANIGAGTPIHMDFGAGQWEGINIGIPFNIVNPADKPTTFNFLYADESDNGPYPIGGNPLVEGGSDRHFITLDTRDCKLYELFNYRPPNADSGAVWDLKTNATRPFGWTSADAAGLPILPGLIRYDEPIINHALRFTASKTHGSIAPASHATRGSAGISYPDQPPLGARYRLKASFDTTPYDTRLQPILTALKTYGMILADNGGEWYISGTHDERWDNDLLATLHNIRGAAFEVVDTSCTLTLSTDKRVVRASGGMVNVTVTSSCDWLPDAGSPWLKPIRASPILLSIVVARNDSKLIRSGRITVRDKYILIQQLGY